MFEELASEAPGSQANDPTPRAGYILSSRLRHAWQVTRGAGGSAHPERLPGSSEHSAMRQCGVTAW